MIYNNGRPVVNEIEDAVGTRMLYSLTDIDPVREFVVHIAEHFFGYSYIWRNEICLGGKYMMKFYK